jgi:hypothetical protein
MKPTAKIGSVLVLAALLACGLAVGPGRTAAVDEPGEPKLIVRTYDVRDIVRLGRHRPYDSSAVPPTELLDGDDDEFGYEGESSSTGGIFEDEVESRNWPARPMGMAALIDVIRSTVDPEGWLNQGAGRGVIRGLGGLLVVSHTAATHEKIAALLTDIRKQYASVPMVTVEAAWVVLEADAAAKLLAAEDGTRPQPRVVDPGVLRKAGASVRCHGRVTGFAGQAVHVVSGQAQGVVVGYIPVVASHAAAARPIVKLVQWGAILEATPSLCADGRSVLLDVYSVVSRPHAIRQKAVTIAYPAGGKDRSIPAEPLDMIDCDVHTLGTAVKLPLNQMVLVGGMTLAGKDADERAGKGGRPEAMYLLVRVSAAGAKAAAK